MVPSMMPIAGGVASVAGRSVLGPNVDCGSCAKAFPATIATNVTPNIVIRK